MAKIRSCSEWISKPTTRRSSIELAAMPRPRAVSNENGFATAISRARKPNGSRPPPHC
uniref:Uncharacterized protein n=1 Tax=uncultured marine virus TaxID=186617 RepID=A0A0F7L996_9VIRU|nr:hypothetical protein [uncultured marine virus]